MDVWQSMTFAARVSDQTIIVSIVMLLIINNYQWKQSCSGVNNKWKFRKSGMANFLGYSSQSKLGPSLIKVTFEQSGLKYHFLNRHRSTGFYSDLRGATWTTEYEIIARYIP